jgi:hypothetical protein
LDAGLTGDYPEKRYVWIRVIQATSAEIDIDGGFVGNTPSSIHVSSGEHVLKITKRGFVPWEKTIKAMPGRAAISPELQPAGASEPQ